MKTLTLLVLLFTATAFADTIDDKKMLYAIGQIETGGNRNATNGGINGAVGMYQMRVPAWKDANAWLKSKGQQTFERSEWRSDIAQDAVALAYLQVIKYRLKQMGVKDPTVEVVALCWNQGCGYARSHGFIPNDYAQRVGNIYNSLP